MSDRPTAAHDLPAEMYPVHIYALAQGTVEVLWQESILDPPAVIEVPGRDALGGQPVDILILYANGGHAFADAPPEPTDGSVGYAE